ncbi:MAG: EamA family transporter [Alphaproteobacteria bacterium]
MMLQNRTPQTTDVLLTATAPAIWGSTYYVTTEFLPDGYPLTMAVLRALPAGLLLLLLVRQLPGRDWIGRVILLGALNFAVFWALLFVAAYRLPGGVAATLGAIQPLLVIVLARGFIGTPIRAAAVAAAAGGLVGVAMLTLGPDAALDGMGVVAALGGAAAMAAGTVLSRKWQPPTTALTFTSWQLTAGGLLLLPAALVLEPPLPTLDASALGGIAYLCLIGAALTYVLWFRGLARLEPSAVSALAMMSPVTAVLLGWLALGEGLTPVQIGGAAIVLAAVLGAQLAPPRTAATPAPHPATAFGNQGFAPRNRA